MKFVVEACGVESERYRLRHRLQVNNTWRKVLGPIRESIPLFTLDDKIQSTDRQFESYSQVIPYLSLKEVTLDGKNTLTSHDFSIDKVLLKPKVPRSERPPRFTEKDVAEAIASVLPARDCNLVLMADGYFGISELDIPISTMPAAVYYRIPFSGLAVSKSKSFVQLLYSAFLAGWCRHLHTGDLALDATFFSIRNPTLLWKEIDEISRYFVEVERNTSQGG